MLSNYFTLLRVARALNDRLSGSVVAGAYTQERNTLSLLFYTPEPYTVTICCTARSNYITGREGDQRAKRNSVDRFPTLVDRHVERIYLDRSDRIVWFRCSGPLWVAAEMFGGKANALLIDGNGALVDMFLKEKAERPTVLPVQRDEETIGSETVLPSREKFIRMLRSDEGTLAKRMKRSFPPLGDVLIREIIHRADAEMERSVREVTEEQLAVLYGMSQSVIDHITGNGTDVSFVYFDGPSPVTVSPIPLHHVSSLRCDECPDMPAAVRLFVGTTRSETSFAEKKRALTEWIDSEVRRHRRTLDKVADELAESSRAEAYEKFGSLLMTNAHTITKGASSADVQDTFSQGEPIVIPLDPSLSPVQNAERYFDRAKRAKAARRETQERLDELRVRVETLQRMQAESDRIADAVSLKQYLHTHAGPLQNVGYMTEQEHKELPPFRIFTVEGGFTVYAGKSSENNDLLTMKYAKPNDLWFHARGSGGSHVVLKTGSAAGTPSKRAVEQAASIAAYYSKMKNAKNVPVAVTEKKYVRKSKGAPSGTVILEREKVIFVAPGLPHE